MQSDQSLFKSLEYSMNVQLLAENHLEFLSLKGGCTGWSESTLVKMPHCWKSHVTAQIYKVAATVRIITRLQAFLLLVDRVSSMRDSAGLPIFFKDGGPK